MPKEASKWHRRPTLVPCGGLNTLRCGCCHAQLGILLITGLTHLRLAEGEEVPGEHDPWARKGPLKGALSNGSIGT